MYRNSPSHTVCYVYYPIYWLIDNPSKFIYPNHPHTIPIYYYIVRSSLTVVYSYYVVPYTYCTVYIYTSIHLYIYMNPIHTITYNSFGKAGKSSWRCTQKLSLLFTLYYYLSLVPIYIECICILRHFVVEYKFCLRGLLLIETTHTQNMAPKHRSCTSFNLIFQFECSFNLHNLITMCYFVCCVYIRDIFAVECRYLCSHQLIIISFGESMSHTSPNQNLWNN